MIPIGSQRLHAFFVHALLDSDTDVRCCAMEQIAYLKMSTVADEVAFCLNDENTKLFKQAITTLVKINHYPLVPLLIEKLQQQSLHQQYKLEFLINIIQAISNFAPLKPEENDRLLSLLNNKSLYKLYLARGDGATWNELQKQIMLLLADQQCKTLFPFIQQLSNDASIELQASIYIAMAKIVDKQSDAYLIELLNKAKNKQQILLIRALAFSPSQTTLDALLMLLSRSLIDDISDEIIDVLVRRKASKYLLILLKNICESQNTSALLPTISSLLKGLVKLLDEKDREISVDVNLICSLLREDNLALQQQVMVFLLKYSQISSFYSQLNALNKRLINRCFEIKDDTLLSHACQLLALFADDHNIPVLHKLILNDAFSARVKKEAIATLAQLLIQSQSFVQIQQALDTLSQLCHHPEPLIQASSLQALMLLSNATQKSSIDEQHPFYLLPPINIVLSVLNRKTLLTDEPENEIEAKSEQSNVVINAPLSSLQAIAMDNKVIATAQKQQNLQQENNISQETRYLCARILARNKQKQHEKIIVNSLIFFLDDDDIKMATEAAKSLSHMLLNNPQVDQKNQLLDKLIGFLEHPDSELRCYCFRILSYLDDPAVLTYLLKKLYDKNVQIRCDAIAALAANIDRTMPAQELPVKQIIFELSQCLKDEEPCVVVAAITVLISLNGIDCESAIEQALFHQGQYAEEIALLLKQEVQQQSLTTLLQVLDKLQNSAERITAMRMLAIIFYPEK